LTRPTQISVRSKCRGFSQTRHIGMTARVKGDREPLITRGMPAWGGFSREFATDK
jgi:hypothetical protein